MNSSFSKAVIKILFITITLWMVTGCTQVHRPSDSASVSREALKEPPPSDFYVHKVRWSGETLSVITQWYTGTYKKWPTVAKANPSLDPNKISKGDEILIPIDLLKTNEPMPHEFLRTSSRKKKSSPSRHLKHAAEPIKIGLPKTQKIEHLKTEPDEVELFGPQVTEQTMPESDKIELSEPQTEEQSVPEIEDIELFGPQGTSEPMAENDDIELFGPHDGEQSMAETNDIELYGPKDTEPQWSESDEIELFER